MTDSEKSIYISIRAEHICSYQEKTYGSWYQKHSMPLTPERFKEFAAEELERSLESGELLISLEDLLLKETSECLEIISAQGGSHGPACIDIWDNIGSPKTDFIILGKAGSGISVGISVMERLYEKYGKVGAEIIIRKCRGGEDISSYL